MAKTKGDKPIREITFWPVRVSIWRNESEAGHIRYTTTVSRLYKDEDEWRSTHGLDLDDLLPAARALEQAFAVIHELTTADRKAA